MLVVKCKKTHQNASLPKQNQLGDAGLDLTCAVWEIQGDQFIVDTGIAVDLPQGCPALLLPRSGIVNTGLRLANGVGLIDPNYRGSLKLVFDIVDKTKDRYKIGDRVGQLLVLRNIAPVHCIETTELSPSNRGTQGFGSSGK